MSHSSCKGHGQIQIEQSKNYSRISASRRPLALFSLHGANIFSSDVLLYRRHSIEVYIYLSNICISSISGDSSGHVVFTTGKGQWCHNKAVLVPRDGYLHQAVQTACYHLYWHLLAAYRKGDFSTLIYPEIRFLTIHCEKTPLRGQSPLIVRSTWNLLC